MICCCYRNCYAAIATLTSSFATVATTNALSLVCEPEQTATLQLLQLTSFATIATPIAYADASVARFAVLTAVIVRMLLLHIQKATLPLLLLTNFATIATAIAYGDASVARVAVLTAVIVRMLLLLSLIHI